MTQPDIAQLLNQHILGDRASFPCGCVLGCEVRYPNRDWVYTDYALHSCAEHPTQPQFVGKFGGMFDIKQELLYGPLEKKWLKPDGTRVTIAELEAAMEEALERIDQEEEEAVEQVFRSQRVDALHKPFPKRAPVTDPHIASVKGKHAIGRHGTVSPIPQVLKLSLMQVHAEFIMESKGFKPGELVDLRKLRDEYVLQKTWGFNVMYGDPALNTVDITARTAKKIKDITTGLPKEILFGKMRLNEEYLDKHWVPLSIQVMPYNRKDTELAYELIKGREQKSQQHYDTLPLTLMMDALKPSQGVQSESVEKPMGQPEDEGKEHG